MYNGYAEAVVLNIPKDRGGEMDISRDDTQCQRT